MTDPAQRTFISGFRIISLLTLLSRMLGMLRDVATAGVFGASGSAVMDAFVIAFRVPDFFRRLFGEGAITASYLPVISERIEHDRRSAEQVATAMLAAVLLAASVLLVLGELTCLLLLQLDLPHSTQLFLQFSTAMFPYVLFICATAQMATTLHALKHFTAPALASSLLNVSWLAGLGIAVMVSDQQRTQAFVLIFCLVIAGLLQALLQWLVLRRRSFCFRWDWQASRPYLQRIAVALLPAILGLSVTQLNTVLDSLVAWILSSTPTGSNTIHWLGEWTYPLQQGAASTTYYAERLYMFPLGLIGIASATVIFPLLSQHAARGHFEKLTDDLTTGLRFVLFLGIPASVGLCLLADPIVRLLFQRGQFTADDSLRTAAMIRGYAVGIWAFCALPVIVRGYYAVGDLRRPVRIGAVALVVNLVLNLALVWPLAEVGIALGTSISAGLQLSLLLWCFSQGARTIDAGSLLRSVGKTVGGAVLMAVCGLGIVHWNPISSRLFDVLIPLIGCVIVYLLWARVARQQELGELLAGEKRKK